MKQQVTVHEVVVDGRTILRARDAKQAERYRKFYAEEQGCKAEVKPLTLDAYDEGDRFYTGPVSERVERGVVVKA